jgi:hypothetical protein
MRQILCPQIRPRKQELISLNSFFSATKINLEVANFLTVHGVSADIMDSHKLSDRVKMFITRICYKNTSLGYGRVHEVGFVPHEVLYNNPEVTPMRADLDMAQSRSK